MTTENVLSQLIAIPSSVEGFLVQTPNPPHPHCRRIPPTPTVDVWPGLFLSTQRRFHEIQMKTLMNTVNMPPMLVSWQTLFAHTIDHMTCGNLPWFHYTMSSLRNPKWPLKNSLGWMWKFSGSENSMLFVTSTSKWHTLGATCRVCLSKAWNILIFSTVNHIK